MAKAIVFTVLLQLLAQATGFSIAATPPQAVVVRPVQQSFAPALPRGATWSVEDAESSSSSLGAGALLAGVFVTTAALLRSSRRSPVARGPWQYQPMDWVETTQGVEGASPRGPSYRLWITLRKQAKKGYRYHRQQKILRDSGIESAKGGFPVWFPDRARFNLYKGPESHPDNPWFPAASSGYDKAEMGPPLNGVQTRSPYLTSDQVRADDDATPSIAAGAFASSRVLSTRASFAGLRVPTFAISARSKAISGARRSSRFGVIMHAHKKAASSTKNQGRHQNPQYYGLFRKGKAGNAVKAGQMLLRQKGYKWYPGANISVGKNYTFNSLKDGIVQWRGNPHHKEIFVVPWEYVRTKCQWIRPNCLGPKKYEPWMGKEDHHKRHHILKMREEWLESDEGKAYMAKKKEKADKQKEIQKKIRAIRKARRAGVREDTRKEEVSTGGEA